MQNKKNGEKKIFDIYTFGALSSLVTQFGGQCTFERAYRNNLFQYFDRNNLCSYNFAIPILTDNRISLNKDIQGTMF